MGARGGSFLVGGVVIARLKVERSIILRRRVASAARRAAGGKAGLGVLQRSE